jgi:succinate dehydrogenase hydrophobic anchor subunit
MSPSTPLQLYERGPSWLEYVPPVVALFLVLSLAYFTLVFDVAGVSAWFGVVYQLFWVALALYAVYLLYRLVAAVERLADDERF